MNLKNELARMQKMTVAELRDKYAELFGETTRSGNRDFLTKRIAWRLQALEEGDFEQRIKRIRAKALAIANDADLRVRSPKPRPSTAEPPDIAVVARVGPRPTKRKTTIPNRDPRLPRPGTILTRLYKDAIIQVTVGDSTFEYEGLEYPSLSAVAKAVTGSHMNGFRFFKLDGSR